MYVVCEIEQYTFRGDINVAGVISAGWEHCLKRNTNMSE